MQTAVQSRKKSLKNSGMIIVRFSCQTFQSCGNRSSAHPLQQLLPRVPSLSAKKIIKICMWSQ